MTIEQFWMQESHGSYIILVDIRTDNVVGTYVVTVSSDKDHAELLIKDLTNNSFLDVSARRIMSRNKLGGFILEKKVR